MYQVDRSPLNVAAAEWIAASGLSPIILTTEEMEAGVASGKYTSQPGGMYGIAAQPNEFYEWHNWQYDHGWGAYLLHTDPASYARDHGWQPTAEIIAAEREYYDASIGGMRSVSSDAAMEEWETAKA